MSSTVPETKREEATYSLEVSILLPCLNEAETIGQCVREAQDALRCAGIVGEILVVGNGSVDGSAAIAERLGARVVHASCRGYGNAVRAGIEAASGVYVIMADADGSYDLAHIPRFLEQLRAGHDLVVGNRFTTGRDSPNSRAESGGSGARSCVWKDGSTRRRQCDRSGPLSSRRSQRDAWQ
jgi:glycosyltransferase involved in cell wall biosynthesis